MEADTFLISIPFPEYRIDIIKFSLPASNCRYMLSHVFCNLYLIICAFVYRFLFCAYHVNCKIGIERRRIMDYKRMNEFRLLGLTIAYYRRLRGMTQMELAEAVQISRTHMSNIEAPNSKTSISLGKLFDIADALEVPVKDLFDFRDNA